MSCVKSCDTSLVSSVNPHVTMTHHGGSADRCTSMDDGRSRRHAQRAGWAECADVGSGSAVSSCGAGSAFPNSGLVLAGLSLQMMTPYNDPQAFLYMGTNQLSLFINVMCTRLPAALLRPVLCSLFLPVCTPLSLFPSWEAPMEGGA